MRAAEDAAKTLDAENMLADSDPIKPARVYGELRKILAPDAVTIGDGGDFVSYAGKYLEPATPGSWLDPGPYGCLGTGLGYAMGARVTYPDRQICVLMGDGAAGFSLMDVESLVRQKLPVVMVVGNNGIWGLEKHPMRAMYGYDVAADLQPHLAYDAVVAALGGAGETVAQARRPGRRAAPGVRLRRALPGQRADGSRRRLPALGQSASPDRRVAGRRSSPRAVVRLRIQVDAATPIVGGDECLLWHVTAPRSLVVRAAPSWRSDAELRWAYGVAAALRTYVPEVVTPESPAIVRWRGRAVTIWPYVPGGISIVTGRMIVPPPHGLARLHRAAARSGRRIRARCGVTDRRTSIRVARRIGRRSHAVDDIVDPELDDTLASWRIGAGARAARAGARRLLPAQPPRSATVRLALLDWDEARIDAVSVELAWSVWEFGHIRIDARPDPRRRISRRLPARRRSAVRRRDDRAVHP